MQYMGSKRRIAKDILPIILKDRKPDQYYVEPFVGGANTIDKVCGPRIGNDLNPYLISMWKALQNGWCPPEFITKEEYANIKNNKEDYPEELVSFVGFLVSFGGKWFGGYSQNKKGDNYALRGKNVLIKQIESLRDVEFYSLSYDQLTIPSNSIIYCDPPYKGTTQYKNKFDSDKFWVWCDSMVSLGHKVFVSEFEAPIDWDCVYTTSLNTILNKNSQDKQATEKLFTKSL